MINDLSQKAVIRTYGPITFSFSSPAKANRYDRIRGDIHSQMTYRLYRIWPGFTALNAVSALSAYHEVQSKYGCYIEIRYGDKVKIYTHPEDVILKWTIDPEGGVD